MADGPQVQAEAAARAMLARDNASRALGMELLAVAPGRARMRMRLRDDMLNGHGTGHGGMVFALADSAFAFACNAHGGTVVALACQITFVAPARAGDELEAEVVEQARSGRTGVYDVTVRNQRGETVALFRGNSYRTRDAAADG